jgi:hypothetical protein
MQERIEDPGRVEWLVAACPKCGDYIEKGQKGDPRPKFCKNCGGQLFITCKCGAPLLFIPARYCYWCGESLGFEWKGALYRS